MYCIKESILSKIVITDFQKFLYFACNILIQF